MTPNKILLQLFPENIEDYKLKVRPDFIRSYSKSVFYLLSVPFCCIIPIIIFILTIDKYHDYWWFIIFIGAVSVPFFTVGGLAIYSHYHLLEHRNHLRRSIETYQETRKALIAKRFILYLRGFGQESIMKWVGTPENLFLYTQGESLIPQSVLDLSNKFGVPIIGFGNRTGVVHEENVAWLFCDNLHWEELLKNVLIDSTLVIVNLFHTTREILRASTELSPGLEKEIDILIRERSFLKKVVALHNNPIDSKATNFIAVARWNVYLESILGLGANEKTPLAFDLPDSLYLFLKEKLKDDKFYKQT